MIEGENKGAEAIADCESRNAEWEDRWTNKEVEDKVTLLLKQRHFLAEIAEYTESKNQ